MKAKLLIYGAGQFAERFMQECLDGNKAEVIAFVESVKSKNKFRDIDVISVEEMGGGKINNYAYDLLIVISAYLSEIRENLMKYQINLDKCIFTTDIHNWFCTKKTISLFMNILRDDYIDNEFKMIVEKKKVSSYGVVETFDGLSFIGNYADDLMGEMIDTGKVYSYMEIDAFIELSDKYYDLDKGGYFFDCGCNILTTSIYVLNKRDDLKVIAFEPVIRTCRIARANAVLNNMEKKISVINQALSDHKGIAEIKCRRYNCGGDYIVKAKGNDKENQEGTEKIHMIALDEWIDENHFDIKQIRYLWIDVEGYEGYVVKGMMRLLRQKKIPMYLEYYTDFLQRSGCKEILLDCLEKVYSKYIVVRRGGFYDISEIHEIRELRSIEDMHENIFLIV